MENEFEFKKKRQRPAQVSGRAGGEPMAMGGARPETGIGVKSAAVQRGFWLTQGSRRV